MLWGVYRQVFSIIVNQQFDFNLPAQFIFNLFKALAIAGIYALSGLVIVSLIQDKLKSDYKIPSSIWFCAGLFFTTYLFMFPGIFFFLYKKTFLLYLLSILVISLYLYKKQSLFKSKDILHISQNRPRIFWVFAALSSGIVFLSFYHGLFYPETYWDSLIYYLHYGKMIYQQHGFPILYTGQVGLGLGANYPHMFHLSHALPAIIFNEYTDFNAQFLSPLAGLVATILVYQTALLLYKKRVTAIITALIFRCIPFVNVYFTYATDYSYVLMFTCALVYTATAYYKTRDRFFLLLSAVFCAAFPNINYLGWIFVPVFLLIAYEGYQMTGKEKQKEFLKFAGLCLGLLFVLGIPWYIRNWIITGNPVYAFYPGIFGGKKIDLDVLASCFKEWYANGIGVPGSTIIERLQHAPSWFFRIWQVNPVIYAFTLPGILYYFMVYRKTEKDPLYHRYFRVVFLIFVLGLAYHLLVSNLYLYQVIFIFPAAVLLLVPMIEDIRASDIYLKYSVYIVIVLVAISPGLTMSLMGPKLMEPSLLAFRNPGINPGLFYNVMLRDYAPMRNFINRNLDNTVLLTHENRYHLYKDSITFRHLDDWEIIPLYKQTDIDKKAHFLYNLGIRYYLFIPNERNHPILQKLEIRKMIEKGYLTLLFESGEYQLYQFNPSPPPVTP